MHRQLSYFETTTLQYEIREKEEEERAAETLRSASRLLELHYSQSCRANRESFVGRVLSDLLCLIYSISITLQKAGREENS